jgi:hypothetical protein
MTAEDTGSAPPSPHSVPNDPESGRERGPELERVESAEGAVTIRLPSGIEMEWEDEP